VNPNNLPRVRPVQPSMARRLTAALGVVLLLGGPAAGQPTPKPGKAAADAGPKPTVVERVVAVVNNEVILESELYQHAAPMLADLQQQGGDARERQKQYKTILRQALDDLINEELIVQAATEAELTVEDGEVDKAIAEVKKQNKLTDAQLADALRSQGLTMAQYRRDVRRQILRLRTVNTLVRPRVSVSEEEIKERYEKEQRQSGAVTEVHVAHILVAVPETATRAEREAARRRAGELVERARGGEDFTALVTSSSDDDGSKAAGGDLGWFKRSELPTAWETELFAAEAGDIRGPLDGPRGVHVFKITESKRDAIKPYAEVKDALQRELYGDEMEKQTRLWIEELRRKANIEIKL
jgi:peptidyl-prolyl cis-trans isomerase SurA